MYDEIMKVWYAVVFGAIFAILGWLFSTKAYISFMDKRSPVEGLVLYYAGLYVVFILLQSIGMKIGNVHFDTHLHTIGGLMILYAFFIVFSWESEYTCRVVGKDCTPKHTEDALFFYLAKKMGLQDCHARVLTYVIAPFVLTVVGVLLIFDGHSVGKMRLIKIS